MQIVHVKTAYFEADRHGRLYLMVCQQRPQPDGQGAAAVSGKLIGCKDEQDARRLAQLENAAFVTLTH